jgi:hypothetical protein
VDTVLRIVTGVSTYSSSYNEPSAHRRSEGYGIWFVNISVCLSVCQHVFFHHMQQVSQKMVQCYIGFVRKQCVQSGVKTQVKMPMCKLSLTYLNPIPSVCVASEVTEASSRDAYNACLASPCQTLRKLARYHDSKCFSLKTNCKLACIETLTYKKRWIS